MLRVVLARFLFGDGQLGADLLPLDLLDQHLALQLLAQIVHGHVLGRQRLLELLVVLKALLLADVGDDGLELVVAEVQAELPAALRQQQLVDALTRICGVNSESAFFRVSSFFSASGSTCLPASAGAKRRRPAAPRAGLRDDVAVDLHRGSAR
jgi:hypothetical protein